MPSQALHNWNTVRRPRLNKVDAVCVAAAGLVPADPDLVDEHLRAYVGLLSAHYQGFCRDLYSEAVQLVVAKVPKTLLKPVILAQFEAGLELSGGNPTLDKLTADFGRFGIVRLNTVLGPKAVADRHKGRLSAMNRCRNHAAHGESPIPDLSLANVRLWRASCQWVATRLDAIVYDRLKAMFRRSPW